MTSRCECCFVRAGKALSNMAQLAPEALSRGGKSIGKHADVWAAGVLSTRLLTDYFPFDDIICALRPCCAVALRACTVSRADVKDVVICGDNTSAATSHALYVTTCRTLHGYAIFGARLWLLHVSAFVRLACERIKAQSHAVQPTWLRRLACYLTRARSARSLTTRSCPAAPRCSCAPPP